MHKSITDKRRFKKKMYELVWSGIETFSASDAAKSCSYLKALLNEKELGLTLEDILFRTNQSWDYWFKEYNESLFQIVKTISRSNESDLDPLDLRLRCKNQLLKQAGVANWISNTPQEAIIWNIPLQIAKLKFVNG